jgi:hypothetical protein
VHGGFRVCILQESVFFELVLKRSTADPKNFRSFLPVVGGVSQGKADQQLLDFSQGHPGADLLFRGGPIVCANEVGKIAHLDGGILAGDDQPLDDVSKLPDIAGPGETLAQLDGFLVKSFSAAFVFRGEMFEKGINEQGDIFGSFAQGWERDGDNLKAVEKILAKLTF